MKLDEKFMNSLRESLINNKKHFKANVVDLYETIKTNEQLITFLDGRLCRKYPTMFEEQYAKNIISKTFLSHDVPSLKKTGFWFQLKGREETFDAETQEKANEITDQNLNNSMVRFWANQNNNEVYSKFSSFNCFLEVTLSIDNSRKYLNSNGRQVFNVTDWIRYFNSLIEFLYPDFEFNKKISNSNTIRFSKLVGENLLFGIEYSVQEFKYRIKRNSLQQPELKFFLSLQDFDKKTKSYSLHDNTYWELNDINNPFFSIGRTLASYYASKNIKKESEGVYICDMCCAKQEILPNNMVRIYNDETLGDELKKMAFYELYNQAFHNKSYIHYLESSIMDTLKKIST